MLGFRVFVFGISRPLVFVASSPEQNLGILQSLFRFLPKSRVFLWWDGSTGEVSNIHSNGVRVFGYSPMRFLSASILPTSPAVRTTKFESAQFFPKSNVLLEGEVDCWIALNIFSVLTVRQSR